MINNLVIRFANVNGTGSASANTLFAKAISRMGVPMSPKNIFPSNIQGLPTWYEVRVSEDNYLGRRDGIDIMVCLNPQSQPKDIESVRPGGYFIYDNTKPLHEELFRADISYLGIPMTEICRQHFPDPKTRLLLKNVLYVGALTALLDMELEVLRDMIQQQYKKNEKLIPPNFQALDLGYNFAKENFSCPLPLRIERRDLVGDRIILDGNSACALGALYAGATVAAWYPITPSTSVVNAFEKYANRLRIDPETGKKRFAVVQAEDELAALGMVIGASWNGARAFTATSGPGLSLMQEFLGLAYFAEIPAVLVDVQRTGPSTGMPTRTQQSDVLLAAYASHGDTKQVVLFPATPKECFDLTADAFDLTERLQTPVIILSDLDLGMNEHLSEPLTWDETRRYDRGKVLSADELDQIDRFGRYLDVDGDAIPYRTLPGTHPTKGAFFTRGSSRDEYARYTEDGAAYQRNMERLLRKFETAKGLVPKPVRYQDADRGDYAILFYGTTTDAALEARDRFEKAGLPLDALRVRAFPFDDSVKQFLENHGTVFVIEQNRDAQLRTLLMNELDAAPNRLVPILNYDGFPITADFIEAKIRGHLKAMTKPIGAAMTVGDSGD